MDVITVDVLVAGAALLGTGALGALVGAGAGFYAAVQKESGKKR